MDINELHDRLFEILCTIDDICSKEGIRWFLDSGTEIGAAREQDFIPWDDDMDIKILAEDWIAFKLAMEKNLPPYMHIVEPEAFAPGFYDFTIRIYDERYLLREETDEEKYYKNLNNYVGTDVFIFAKTPDSELIKKKMIIITKILYGMGMAHRYECNLNKYSLLQKIQVLVLNTVGKMFSPEKICFVWKKSIFKYTNKKAAWYFSSNYSLPSLRFFPASIYEGTVYLSIRGKKFPVPAGYHEELTLQYGEYMKPPKDRSIYRTHL